MRHYHAIGLLLILFLSACTTIDVKVQSKISGAYFGQVPPGDSAVLFASGILSTGMYELNSAFFPGGKEVIFSVSVGQMQWMMFMMKEENGQWSEPYPAPFNGVFGGVDQWISKDGQRIYFCSNRPRDGQGEVEDNYDIWYVDKMENGWSEAINMGAPVNTDAHEFYPSLANNGTLYFQSRREGGLGASDIYMAIPENGRFVKVEHLPTPINSPTFEGDAMIAPDESYLIVSTRREDCLGQSDLYISFRNEDKVWGELINMGSKINTAGGENCQILSPCGKYLFFVSRRSTDFKQAGASYQDLQDFYASPQNGRGDIYWVSTEVIGDLKNGGGAE
jgi:Tol biopolymer transport system component